MVDREESTDQSLEPVPLPHLSVFTSEAALSFSEARTLTGRRGATVVLLVGEVGVGKTTLLVELWSQFLLKGTIFSHRFAGSRTALAFEERSYHSRVQSGAVSATTTRTQEADGGFLHLRIQRPDDSLLEILFADISGECFGRIRGGTTLLDELPWAVRVDRFLVILDGKAYVTPGEREIVMNRARRQIIAMRNCEAVNETARVAIALTKIDELLEDDFHRFSNEKDLLLADVQNIDDEATSMLIAARPSDGTEPRGLDNLVEWLCGGDKVKEADPHSRATRPSRAIGRFVS